MSYSIEKTGPIEEREHFRCPVTGVKGKATLRVGRTKMRATVMETSVRGYTITVAAKYAKQLARNKRDFTICYDGTKARVRSESVSKPKDGLVRVGLLQIEDLTKPERIKRTFWSHFRVATDPSTTYVAYAGFVLFLFAAMSLPGLGDKLGTSSKIQKTFCWIVSSASEQFDAWLG